MKFAPTCSFTAVIACLMAQGHGVYGSTLRAAQSDKEAERKLQNYQEPYGYHQQPYYPRPKATPNPTERPTPRPTPVPTNRPTPQPTHLPTPRPSPRPTPDPTSGPTPNPTHPHPTPKPTPHPTHVPPTLSPTRRPTHEPTGHPTFKPTPHPTYHPTFKPTPHPTKHPVSSHPTSSEEPSEQPTYSEEPSESPTYSEEPSETPTNSEEPTQIDLLTIAQIICSRFNVNRFGDLCAIIQVTGLYPLLNRFEDELQAIDQLIDELNDIVDDLAENVNNGDFQYVADRINRLNGNNRKLQTFGLIGTLQGNFNNIPIGSNGIVIGDALQSGNFALGPLTVANRGENLREARRYRNYLRQLRSGIQEEVVSRRFVVFAPTNDAIQIADIDDVIDRLNLVEINTFNNNQINNNIANLNGDIQNNIDQILDSIGVGNRKLTSDSENNKDRSLEEDDQNDLLRLRFIVLNHISESGGGAQTLTCQGVLAMESGEDTITECRRNNRFQIGEGNYQLGDAPQIVVGGQRASNGVVFGTNRVILPNLGVLYPSDAPSGAPSISAGPSDTPSTSAAPSGAPTFF